MKRMAARAVLVACVALWGTTLWALNVGALAQELPVPLQTCVPGGPPPVGCPEETGTPSPTGSSTPSPSPSDEEPTEEDSTVTIKYKDKKFSGAVKSDSPACERGREVSVKKRGGKTIGKDRTNNRGKYSVRYPKPKGKRYFAKVAAKKTGGTTCNGAKSKTIKAG